MYKIGILILFILCFRAMVKPQFKNSSLLLTRGLNILLLPISRRKDYYDFELKLRPFIYLKETQCPFDPVDWRVGLFNMALTVLAASGAFGSWDVSKKA